ncbi:MAG TPA: hypothetical protein VNI01_15160 [Elusimicrobiota bacterium]|nr:hypothetical protein [Elusimicrobiota bacterium]
MKALLLSLAGAAAAYITVGNQRIDHAIYAEHEPKLVVGGEITGTESRPRPAAAEDYPADVGFAFRVDSVVLGDPSFAGKTLELSVTAFDWPESLLPFRKGERCALVLDARGNALSTVVPVARPVLPRAKDGAGAKLVLKEELLAVLRQETRPDRQRSLILEATPLLSKTDKLALIPFAASKNAWLRRAALAALVYSTKERGWIDAARVDIERFIAANEPNAMIDNPDGRPGFAPFPLLFTNYFFLTPNWDEAEKADALFYAPLFRAIAHSKIGWTYWEQGIGGLCLTGTRADAAFLYSCYRDLRSKKVRSEPAWVGNNQRRDILQGLSRIFSIGLPSYTEHDFLKDEENQRRKAVAALLREKIIAKE